MRQVRERVQLVRSRKCEHRGGLGVRLAGEAGPPKLSCPVCAPESVRVYLIPGYES